MPLVDCITSNKGKKTYDEIVTFVKARVQAPESITTDIELATIKKALKRTFPVLLYWVVSFILGNCLCRNIQYCEPQQWYVEANNVFFINQLQVLALFLPSDVDESFDKSVNISNANNEELLHSFRVYCVSTW